MKISKQYINILNSGIENFAINQEAFNLHFLRIGSWNRKNFLMVFSDFLIFFASLEDNLLTILLKQNEWCCLFLNMVKCNFRITNWTTEQNNQQHIIFIYEITNLKIKIWSKFRKIKERKWTRIKCVITFCIW